MKKTPILCTLLLSVYLGPLGASGHEKTLKNNQWELINFPLNTYEYSIGELLGDDLAEEDYGTTWTLWAFDGTAYFNPELGKPPQSGEAFWIIQATGNDVIIDVPEGVMPSDTYAARGCSAGERCRVTHPISKANDNVWSLVGTSFGEPKNFADLRIANGDTESSLLGKA